ncbi:peptide chain release factor N(5)-glutamine methyltransferase [Chishuiella sp.]|uniref:peptide chain release factor N(5)-glutamine methyltransferase n=1 Tax=Chishuiella sp. TaxID=1969467 RepID=UPI0028B24604|nr:peptide chain release factor N(5)-glutamine methyltransferase [Chishuiella sp.]
MTLAELKQIFISKLEKCYDKNEIEQLFLIYIEDKLNLTFNPSFVIENEENIEKDILLLQEYKPIQHITGKAFFYDDFFKVSQHTLIPRPETEELIELIRNNHSENDTLSIIDLGTGSGCIPISLKKIFRNANVAALDISNEALQIAKENAKNIVNNEITFYENDLLKDINLAEKFDIIISNPPYIRNLEKQEMHKNVLEHEPHLALFVDDNDPLVFYKRVIEFAKNHLNKNGFVYCEINQYLPEETKELFDEHFRNVEVIKDISGNYRMLIAN